MPGSWLMFRHKQVKMACSFTERDILATLLVVSSLFCACFAEKEYILKRESLWENKSTGGQDQTTSGWLHKNGLSFACGKYINAMMNLKTINTRGAKRLYLVIEYKITNDYGRSSSGLFLWSVTSKDGKLSKESGDSGPQPQSEKVVIGKTVTQDYKFRTLHFDLNKDDNYIHLSFQALRVCATMSKITVYYYVCPANDSLGVKWTAAPSEGFVEARANCSIRQSGKEGSVVFAKCDSKGNWLKMEDKDGVCTNDCGPGTELINDTCTDCKRNYYKNTRGTHACKQCPANTESKVGSTRCTCVEGYYQNTENGPCKTIPSKPKNLKYTRLPANEIQLRWNMTGGKLRDHESGLHFHVKCRQHQTSQWKPCKNLSLGEKGKNVSKNQLKVGNLLNNTNYTFIVTALNEVSAQVSQADWNLATINVNLPGSTVTHTRKETQTSTKKILSSTTVDTKVVSEETPDSTATTVTVTTPFSSDGQLGKTVPQNDNPNTTTELAPYIGIAIGAIFFIFILFLVVHYKRKHTKRKTIRGFEEDLPLHPRQQAYIDPAKYGNPEKAVRKFAKEIDRREIKLDCLIGEGEFAKVHKGMLCRMNEPPVPVALKILKPGSSPKNREDFLTEAAVMGQFKDLNIVALEGVVTISHPVMIVTEFMHNGALSNFLVKHKNRFSELELLGMSRGIASGMKYLARMRYVHRDLAARNVLVNENLVCKVADFGLTRELEESCQGEYVTQGGKIPIRWTAPEAYKHRRFTTASDVWSYGIVLWEIMSYADRPYGTWDNYMVMDQVTANYRLTAPTNCPKIVHQLMMECWKADRSLRPSFSDIVEMLDRWIRNPYLLKDYQYVIEKDLMADRKSCVAKSIREHLEGIKMDRYTDNFIDFGYTELYQIHNMTDVDLVGIGVPLVGHRNKIIKSLRDLRGEKELLLPEDV